MKKMSVNAECNGKNCRDCTIERRHANDAIIADLNEFMAKTYGFAKTSRPPKTLNHSKFNDDFFEQLILAHTPRSKRDLRNALENGDIKTALKLLNEAREEDRRFKK